MNAYGQTIRPLDEIIAGNEAFRRLAHRCHFALRQNPNETVLVVYRHGYELDRVRELLVSVAAVEERMCLWSVHTDRLEIGSTAAGRVTIFQLAIDGEEFPSGLDIEKVIVL